MLSQGMWYTAHHFFKVLFRFNKQSVQVAGYLFHGCFVTSRSSFWALGSEVPRMLIYGAESCQGRTLRPRTVSKRTVRTEMESKQ